MGTINPVADIVARAHDKGAVVVIDGAQAVPQIPVDLSDIGADFYAWTAHKAYGPTGIGVLHGRRELLEAMPPWLTGGHMVGRVTKERTTWAELPHKFEAGTSAIAEGVGLGAAVDFIRAVGIDDIRAARARARRVRAGAPRRGAGDHVARPARRGSPRRGDLVRPGPRAPARRRRDPRARGRLRPRGAPLRAGPDGAARRRRHVARVVRDPQHARGRRRARRRAGFACRRCSADGRPLPRGDPQPLQAAPQLGLARRRRRRVRGLQPALRRPAARAAEGRRGRDDRGPALRRARLRDLAGGGVDGLRRGQGHEGRRAAQARPRLRPRAARESTSPRRG